MRLRDRTPLRQTTAASTSMAFTEFPRQLFGRCLFWTTVSRSTRCQTTVSVAFSAGGDGVHHVALIDAQIAEPCWWRHSPTSICLRKILPLDRGGKGRARWTLRLLENKVVELGTADIVGSAVKQPR